MKLFTLFFVLISCTLCTVCLAGYDIKEISRTELSQDKEFIAYPMSICVTEDELYLVTDFKLGHIKLYNNQGKLLKTIGKKGFGPGEFDRPGSSFYENKRYGVLDYTTRYVHFYDRLGKTNFKRAESVYCHASSTGLHFKDNKIYLGGYHFDKEGQNYSLYSVDVNTKKVRLLLPVYHKFNFRSWSEYKAKHLSPLIGIVGARAVFAVGTHSAYFSWEGDLNVNRVDLKSGDISRFGHKTGNYLAPFISPEITKAFENRRSNSRAYGLVRQKMSLVHDVVASDRYVLVIYRGPIRDYPLLPYWAQFYTPEGKFIQELKLPEYFFFTCMYLDKEKEMLYGLAIDNDDSEKYYIVKMKISTPKK